MKNKVIKHSVVNTTHFSHFLFPEEFLPCLLCSLSSARCAIYCKSSLTCLQDELPREEVKSKLGRVQRLLRDKQHLCFCLFPSQGRSMLSGCRGSKGLAVFYHSDLKLCIIISENSSTACAPAKGTGSYFQTLS